MEAEGWSGILILDSERLRQEVGERKCQWQRKARRRPGETCDRSFLEKGVQRKSRVSGQLGNGLPLYLVVFLAGELRAEVFPWGSLNSLTLPSLVLASPRGLQFPLPVTQPPDSMP